jgi:hypothetical protein
VQSVPARGPLLYIRKGERIHRLTAGGKESWAVSSHRAASRCLAAILTRLHRTEQGVFGIGGKDV